MNKYPLLTDSDIFLKGSWFTSNGIVVADDTSRRIEFLIKSVLVQVGVDSSGWMTLYQDLGDGRYWELSYPDSSAHGGGAPMLRCLSADDVRRNYGHEA